MKNIDKAQIFEWVSRFYVFIFLNIYGTGKILGGQFYRRGALPEEVAATTLGEASAYELGWTFMGYSIIYIAFIGLSQILGAWMLLWNRTKLLGVTILIPIMLNIIVFDIVFLETKGVLANATIYFLMLLYILYFNRVQVKEAFAALTFQLSPAKQASVLQVQNLLLTIVMMAIIFAVDQFLVNLIGH